MIRRPVLTTLFVLVLATFAANLLVASESSLERNSVFVPGEDGYKAYRIPSLIATGKGTVLAFCEGRKNGRGDSGNIDLLVKRSADGGKTWSKPLVVWDDGENTCGNPCPVIDESTGHIHLLMTWNRGDDHGKALHAGTGKGTRRVYYCRSEDDGRTWSKAVEITEQAKDKSWWWYATGPGVGIQFKKGPHKGRLVIPCNHTAVGYFFGAHVIYSDDKGKTWKRSNTIKPTCNESQIVELIDGRLMMNMRSQEHKDAGRSHNGYRSIAFSEDGGATWSDEITITKTGIHGGGTTVDESQGEILAFVEEEHPPARLTVYRSRDDGESWKAEPVTIHPDSKGNMPSMHMNESGITLRHGQHKGRLVRASRYYGEGNRPKSLFPTHYTNAIFSDDGGKTWRTSDPFPENGTGEAAVAELSDGRIYYNSRRHWAPEGKSSLRRWTAWSDDGGATWKNAKICEVLPDGTQDTS